MPTFAVRATIRERFGVVILSAAPAAGYDAGVGNFGVLGSHGRGDRGWL